MRVDLIKALSLAGRGGSITNRCGAGAGPAYDPRRGLLVHQNAKLLALKLDITYNELLMKIVCDPKSRKSMIHRCDNCPGTGSLYDYLYEFSVDLTMGH